MPYLHTTEIQQLVCAHHVLTNLYEGYKNIV